MMSFRSIRELTSKGLHSMTKLEPDYMLSKGKCKLTVIYSLHSPKYCKIYVNVQQ